MYTVVLVDDQPAILQRLTELICDTGIARVIGTDSNSHTALELILRLRPDLVMVDVSMPSLSGVELTKALKSAWSQALVLAVSAHDDGIYLSNMMAAGASGYLLKDDAGTELPEAIKMLMNGGTWISARMSGTGY